MSRNRNLVGAAMAQQQVQASRQRPVAAQMMKDEKYGGAAQIMGLPLARLVALLQDQNASEYAKAKACQRLAVIGDRTAVPALAPLLGEPKLSHYARIALERIPDRSADEALRGALGKVQGNLLVGVVSSIGCRRDANAITALEKLRHDANGDVARAADGALARIRPPL
jgi:HEAT repeat protein